MNDLTIEQAIEQAKELANLLGSNNTVDSSNNTVDSLNNDIIGKKCIIRTYSAGVWFGEVLEKTKDECVIGKARRLYYWKTIKGISLSEVSLYGLDDSSKVQAPVNKVWLQQIELIPCEEVAIKSIEALENYEV